MRKRLRKKKHLLEFQEFGAELRITLRPGTDFDSFLDDFILRAVEANGLSFGRGGKDRELSGFLELGRQDVFRDKLAAVTAWVAERRSVESFAFAEPIDAWRAT